MYLLHHAGRYFSIWHLFFLLLLLLIVPAHAASLPNGYWLTPDTLAWRRDVLPPNLQGVRFELHSPTFKKTRILLPQGELSKTDPLWQKYPFMNGFLKLKPVRPFAIKDLEQWLHGPLLIRYGHSQTGTEGQSTVQTFGLLDHSMAASLTELGVSFNLHGIPTLRLWAPTASQVRLWLFPHPAASLREAQVFPMQRRSQGVWSLSGHPKWKNRFYLYEVQVYAPVYGRVETNLVTDPYSVSLSDNSRRSQIVDLNDPALKPVGWNQLSKPPLKHPTDITLYELHIRDFSQSDQRVPPAWQGRYKAFTVLDSWGMSHLHQLAQSGLTHVHLLPTFDFATVEEYAPLRQEPLIPNSPPDSTVPQQLIHSHRFNDGYNWGYDPWHYSVPEGSYATEPNGSQRILEFRQMVQALNHIGLRVVMDVVYNHTHSAGQDSKAVLDRIVPGYYHRLDEYGQVQRTTCCPDTASERIMMAKLMQDSLLLWAKHYKIDGFRFDLMGHHTRHNLQMIQQALQRLTLSRDGVDGRQIYLYGEGWRFGSLEAIQPTAAMHQFNAAGTGIGTFNDRLRDSLRGGNYEHRTKSDQGFATGLYTDPNHSPTNVETPLTSHDQRCKLLADTDTIRVGLAGNLQDFALTTHTGVVRHGRDVPYRGQAGTGYAQQPQETINYVSAHDNYVLWDQITAKAPFLHSHRQPATATPAEKALWQQLALSVVALGQGIPFFHAGDEILRSKSGDGDSYDSGDWFNRLDYSLQTHNWGVGLPPHERNAQEWNFWQPRLAALHMQPSKGERLQTLAQFHRYLRLRKHIPLLHLPTATAIQSSVRFLNAEPGVIVMQVTDPTGQYDPQHRAVIVAWNANRSTVQFRADELKNRRLTIASELLNTLDLHRYEPLSVATAAAVMLPVAAVVSVPPPNSLKIAAYDAPSGTLSLPPVQVTVWVEQQK